MATTASVVFDTLYRSGGTGKVPDNVPGHYWPLPFCRAHRVHHKCWRIIMTPEDRMFIAGIEDKYRKRREGSRVSLVDRTLALMGL